VCSTAEPDDRKELTRNLPVSEDAAMTLEMVNSARIEG
jgi:hypothetical protein